MMIPSRGFSTTRAPGVKKNRLRISVAFCVRRYRHRSTYIMGRWKTLLYFQHINSGSMEVNWRSNKKAWMNKITMSEWLIGFHHHIDMGRQNLPVDSANHFLSLDPEIIESFNAPCRFCQLSYVLEYFNNNKDSLKAMNLRLVITWRSHYWMNKFMDTTICHHLQESNLGSNLVCLTPPLQPPDMQAFYSSRLSASRTNDGIDLSNSLNPSVEDGAEETGYLREADAILKIHGTTKWANCNST
ncbi:hypothetical protein GcM1_162005 [Golovinomyces cichoracearum]|uniref:DDE-1 domain-containing protein n=1 Tax=Golovinomyces cichoracearum TaxID=62708 RepID=A0A420J8S0_9PEZI|nr:hypothetical protein GcM1_162005 [Golovinomyces cichoracearum]